MTYEKKKRGRKPKKKNDEVKEQKIHKKRGRKPKKKIYNVVKLNENSVSLNNNIQENIILHLPIKSSDLISNDYNIISNFKYDPNINEPIPYENMLHSKNSNINNPMPYENKNEYFHIIDYKKVNNVIKNETLSKKTHVTFSDCDEIDKILNDNISINVLEIDYPETKIRKTLINFSDEISKKSWLKKTDIHCWWCCHQFNNPPCSVPDKFVNGIFFVYGCFCSPNCSVAYILNDNKYNIWEKYSLTIRFCQEVFDSKLNSIKSAGPRESLRIFGGHLSIEQFRKNFNNYINYKLTLPPIKTINRDICEYKISNNDKTPFVPLDDNRVKMASDNLVLSRSKPLFNSLNNLETTMGMSVI